jgi:hypothetical protein
MLSCVHVDAWGCVYDHTSTDHSRGWCAGQQWRERQSIRITCVHVELCICTRQGQKAGFYGLWPKYKGLDDLRANASQGAILKGKQGVCARGARARLTSSRLEEVVTIRATLKSRQCNSPSGSPMGCYKQNEGLSQTTKH